jgi:hypothetical protein
MTGSNKLRIGVVLGLAASLTAGFIACGGSVDQDVIIPPDDAGKDTFVPDNAVPDTGPPDTGKPDTGPQYDAGPPVVLDGGDLYEGGVPCVAGGLIEEEINDEPDAANPVDPAASPCTAPGCSRCGIIFTNDPDAGTDGGTELEYVSYTVHPSAKSFYIQFGGEVTLTVRVGAQGPYVIDKTSSPTIPFVRDQTYFIQVKSNTGKTTPWRVTVFENQ